MWLRTFTNLSQDCLIYTNHCPTEGWQRVTNGLILQYKNTAKIAIYLFSSSDKFILVLMVSDNVWNGKRGLNHALQPSVEKHPTPSLEQCSPYSSLLALRAKAGLQEFQLGVKDSRCATLLQTPIDIDERSTEYTQTAGLDWENSCPEGQHQGAKSVTLKFTGLQPADFQVKNYHAHSVYLLTKLLTQLKRKWSTRDKLKNVIIRGGPADQNYRLEQIHMHWSQSDNDMGSEHSYNGQTYALEAHMVHHRETLAQLLTQPTWRTACWWWRAV
eukprot:g3882.t1